MQIKQWLIHKLGGYATIEEALQAAPQQTLNKAVSDLFCFVSKDDLLKEQGGLLYHKGRQLSEAETKSVCSEAEFLQKTMVWKVLLSETKYHATKRLYFDSQSEHDITWAKLLLYLTDIWKSKVDSLSKLKNKL